MEKTLNLITFVAICMVVLVGLIILIDRLNIGFPGYVLLYAVFIIGVLATSAIMIKKQMFP